MTILNGGKEVVKTSTAVTIPINERTTIASTPSRLDAIAKEKDGGAFGEGPDEQFDTGIT